jgi:glutamate racemase
VDVLVLGCTHYPLLAVARRGAGPRVRLIDSAEETANAVCRELETAGMLAPAGGRAAHQFVVSDDEPRFRRVGARFLGETLQDVAVVPLG